MELDGNKKHIAQVSVNMLIVLSNIYFQISNISYARVGNGLKVRLIH